MSQAYHPFRNQRPRRPSRSGSEDLTYFQRAFNCLKAHPERVQVIALNLAYYQQQTHLPKSAQAAIKRFEYLLSVTNDPHEMEQWVMEDSYEGRKFRQLPLLLKGCCEN